jgi:hypothetical protein
MGAITVQSQVPANAILVEQVTLDRIDALALKAVEIAPTAPRVELEALYAEVQALSKGIEAQRTALKAPALAYERALDAAAKDAQGVLRPTLDTLGHAIKAHLDREEAERQAEIKRQREEAERKQAEENAKADMAAAFAGADEEPAAVVEHLPQRIDPPKAPPPPKSSAIRKTTDYVLVIPDRSKVPVEFAGAELRPIDEATLKRLLRSGMKCEFARLDAVESFASRGSQ